MRESREGSGTGDKKLVAGKDRKSLLLSPDISPNAPNYFRSLGASTVTRDPIILTFGKIKTTKIALQLVSFAAVFWDPKNGCEGDYAKVSREFFAA